MLRSIMLANRASNMNMFSEICNVYPDTTKAHRALFMQNELSETRMLYP
jgi:hypothetical protein